MNTNFDRFFRTGLAIAALSVAGSVSANEFIVGDAVARGGAFVVPVGFYSSGDATDAQVDLTFDADAFTAEAKALGGATCTTPKAGMIRVVSPAGGTTPLAKGMNAYCQVTLTPTGKAVAGDFVLEAAGALCGDASGNAVSACAAQSGSIRLVKGPAGRAQAK